MPRLAPLSGLFVHHKRLIKSSFDRRLGEVPKSQTLNGMFKSQQPEQASINMLIGVPKEIKLDEYRVGLTPASVRELVNHGHQVVVAPPRDAVRGFLKTFDSAAHDQATRDLVNELAAHQFDSFNQSDAAEMTPGEPTNVQIRLWPTSVLIRKGQSLRFCVAGHDDSVFDRVPSEGDPVLTIYRGEESPSFIQLPIVDRDD